MRAGMFAIAFLASTCVASAQTPDLAPQGMPDWMSGYWLSCEEGEQIAENWFGAGTGTLVGASLNSGEHQRFEFLRVAANGRGGVSYYAMPGGNPATAFAMITHENHRAVFENLEHDFPQRLIYTRDGDRLHARAESQINGKIKGLDFNFRRAPADENCQG